jgi:hypothetical protein
MPLPARIAWRTFGRRPYAKERGALLGRQAP